MKKRFLIIIVLFLFVFGLVLKKTYSYYYTNMDLTISSTGSDIKCDAEIQSVSSNEKSIYGYSEFKVVVKNSESNELTGEPFSYTLTFENNTGSDAIFGYNNVFDNNLTINGSLNNDQARTNSHIIQVKSNSGLSENISYKVNLNCVQQY